jgi:hypothetical protein
MANRIAGTKTKIPSRADRVNTSRSPPWRTEAEIDTPIPAVQY